MTLQSWSLLKERSKQIKDESKQSDYHMKRLKRLLGPARRAILRSSRSQMFLKVSQIYTGKHLCWSLFLNKLL